MVVEVAQVFTYVSGAAGAVGAVGAATLGIKSLIVLAKTLRDEMGMGMGESLRESRRIHAMNFENDRRNSLSPEQRQSEDDAKLAALDTPENRQSMKDRESVMLVPMTAAQQEEDAWERHDELKNQGFVNHLPPSTGHKFFNG